MNEQESRQQFDQWLPFYVNTRLDESRRNWMDLYLREHPDALAEVQLQQMLRGELRTGLPETPPDAGLSRLMNRIRTERKASFADRLRESLRGFLDGFASPSLRPAWSVISALLIVQAVAIGILMSGQPESTLDSRPTVWRSVAGPADLSGPVLQITFKPTASEEEMRLLLQQLQGSIIGGPGMLGHYLVRVPADTIGELAERAKQSKIVESVQVLKEIPPED